MRTQIRMRAGVVIAATMFTVAGCAGASTSFTPSAVAPNPPTTSAEAAATSPLAPNGPAGLVVLGDGIGTDQGLWRFEAPDRWVALGPAAGFTAISGGSGGIALGTVGSIDVRSLTGVAVPGAVTQLKWPGTPPSTPVASLDRSPAGSVALALSDGVSSSYAIALPDGIVAVPAAAPRQSFSPIVAWLDDVRLMMLSTDDQQVSRLAVLDVKTNTLVTLKAIGGVRCFAVSGDRATIVAVTEAAVYAAPIGDWLAGTEPRKVVDLGDDQVVWHLALNGDGSALAMLSGTASADGKVAAIAEIGYTAGPGAWKQAFNSPVPFKTARGQAWVG
jgi:hypothetical protein